MRKMSKRRLTGLTAPRAIFFGLDMAGVQLQGADLTGADLRRAIMAGADLGRAVLHGAQTRQIDLTDANLTGVRGLIIDKAA